MSQDEIIKAEKQIKEMLDSIAPPFIEEIPQKSSNAHEMDKRKIEIERLKNKVEDDLRKELMSKGSPPSHPDISKITRRNLDLLFKSYF